MKHTLTVTLLLALALPCVAQEYFLVDAAGKKSGPFQFGHGERVTAGGTNYTVFIPEVERNQHAVVQKMKKIIIPGIDFRQANIHDVVAFLMDASVEFDTGPNPKGIRPVLGLCAQAPEETTPPVDPFAEPETDPDPIPLITFNARNISLYDAMNVACEVAGITWEPRGSAVIFLPKKTEKVQQHGRQISSEGAPSAPPNESSP